MPYANSSIPHQCQTFQHVQSMQSSCPAIAHSLHRRAVLQKAAGLPALLAGLPSAALARSLPVVSSSEPVASSTQQIQDAYDRFSSECSPLTCIPLWPSWAHWFCLTLQKPPWWTSTHSAALPRAHPPVAYVSERDGNMHVSGLPGPAQAPTMTWTTAAPRKRWASRSSGGSCWRAPAAACW